MVCPRPSRRSPTRSKALMVRSRKASCFSSRARFLVVLVYRATFFSLATSHRRARSKIGRSGETVHSNDRFARLSSNEPGGLLTGCGAHVTLAPNEARRAKEQASVRAKGVRCGQYIAAASGGQRIS